MSEYIYLAEIQAWDPSIPGVTTLRFATKGFVTGPADTPPHTYYDGRIVQAASIARNIFGEGRTQGRSRVALGELVLANEDGELDYLADYGFDGRGIDLRRGLPGAAYPAGFPPMLTTTMEQVEVNSATIPVRLRDRQLELDVPLQATKYAGNNAPPAGLEGGEELKSKPKPICYGSVFNVPAVLVNPHKLIYQVADGAVADIVAYDKGIRLSNSYGTWENLADPFGTDAIYHMSFGNGLFVAVGQNAKLMTSPDGITWTARTSSFSGAAGILRVRWNAALSLWFAVAGTDKVATSPDGITWTQRTLAGTPTGINDVAFGNGLVVVVGAKAGGAYIATSTNGTSWTERTAATGSQGSSAVAFGGGLWVMDTTVSSVAKIATSPDAITWTIRNLPAGATGSLSILYSDGFFYTWSSIFLISADGITWVETPAPSGSFGWLTATDSALLAVGDSNLLGTMQKGETGNWMLQAVAEISAAEQINTVATNGADIVVIGTVAGQTATAGKNKTFASLAELEDDTFANRPKPGTIGVYLAGGYFRLGSPPAGRITADVIQGATAANRTAAQIWKLILTRVGMTAPDYSASDITALDTANSAVIGFWTDREMLASEVLDQVAGTVGAWWGGDRAGVYRLKRLIAPAGAGVVAFTESDIVKGSLVREVTRDPGRGIPTWRTILRYARNYTVQTTDLAGGVSTTRRGELAKEWKESPAEDASVKTKHLLAIERIEETQFSTKADADTEAARRQTLRGTRWDFFRFRVQLNPETEVLDLGDVVDISHPRHGFIAGIKCLILGIEHDVEREQLILGVWGRTYIIILMYAVQMAGVWGWSPTRPASGAIVTVGDVTYVDESFPPGGRQALLIDGVLGLM